MSRRGERDATGYGSDVSSGQGNRRQERGWEFASGPVGGGQGTTAEGGWSWLATVRPDGRPHVMPILAAWSGPALFFCSKDSARKSRNLADNDHCVIAFEADDLHLIVEGRARRVGDEATLQRVSEAFKTTYHWDTVVAGDKLDSEVGAPTSSGPPFDVFEVTPTKAFGLPVDGESVTPTRWRF